jgi:hypothetical protein
MTTLKDFLGPDASGCPLSQLLNEAAKALDAQGGGPLAERLTQKAEQAEAFEPRDYGNMAAIVLLPRGLAERKNVISSFSRAFDAGALVVVLAGSADKLITVEDSDRLANEQAMALREMATRLAQGNQGRPLRGQS